MSILNVAEKNSVAKQVANIISRGTKQYQPGKSKYNPIYHFDGERGQKMVFTSVKGHIFTHQLPQSTKIWGSYDNSKILKRDQTPIIIRIADDNVDVVKNLQFQARRANQLILWLDCDRQGQAIAYQVIQICLKINRNLRIKRARFSALTPADIWNAYNNLVQPNKFQADAVNYRSQIDFRLGCTFSRYQTLSFGNKYSQGGKRVLSYGPCQMPTLGFVVQRYLEIKNFKPQPYWAIKCYYYPKQYFERRNQRQNQVQPVEFRWQKRTLRDQRQINRIFVSIFNKYPDKNVIAKIRSRQPHEKKKYRPFPLTTVTLQKLGTDKLKMSSGQIMQIAQKLYHKGFISYPRTQTNSFPNTMNLKQLIKRIQSIGSYENYIGQLLNSGKYQPPKAGKSDDQAHSPIHPVKKVSQNQLSDKQWKIYDLICRHFLACCSKDAIGEQFQVIADVGGQVFKASYLTIKQRNYLQIYTFQRWNESHFGQIPNQFEPLLYIQQSKTTPPGYLTESDLITLMERNQIGTDATIHEHIKTIQDRQYAIKIGSTFKPTTLGVAIISAYRKFDIQLPECQIRRMIEQNMNRIANREIPWLEATLGTLNMMVPIYERLMLIQRDFVQAMSQAISDNRNLTAVNLQQRSGANNDMSVGNQSTTNRNENHNNMNRTGRQFNQNSTLARPNIKCFKCNQQGHYANSCPNGPDGNQGQTNVVSRNPGFNNRNGNSGNIPNNSPDNRCFKCNQPGHFSRDCTNGGNNNFSNTTSNRINSVNQGNHYQQSNFRSGKMYLKCEKQGYYNTQCPDNTNSVNNNHRVNDKNNNSFKVRCYKCNQEGHLANNCKKQAYKQKSSVPNNINNTSVYIRPNAQSNQQNVNIKTQDKQNCKSSIAIQNNKVKPRQHINQQTKEEGEEQQNEQHLNVYRVQRDCNQALSWIQKEMIREMSYCNNKDIKCVKCNRKGHCISQCPLGFTMPTFKQSSQRSQKKKAKRKQNKNNSKQKPTFEQRSISVNFQSANNIQTSNGFSEVSYRNNNQNPVQGDRSRSWESSHNNQQKKGKKKQTSSPCAECGHVGRHPRGSSCPTIKRKFNKSSFQDDLSQINQQND